MAVTVTAVLSGKTTYIADITATADADTDTGNVAHGLESAPLDYSVAAIEQATAELSAWAITSVDATNIVVTKSTAVGSGSANKQVRVRVSLPHSIVS